MNAAIRSSDTQQIAAFLTRNQERTGFVCQFENDVTAYSVPVALRIEGLLNVEALERACHEVFRRYTALRLRLENGQDGIGAAFDPESFTPVTHSDLKRLPESEREREVTRITNALARQPFDLFKGPLVRASLLKLAPGKHLLVTVFHELAADAPSSAIFVRDLMQEYAARVAGREAPSPDQDEWYDSYVLQERAAEGPGREEALAFWREELGGDLPVLDLPVDHPPPPVYSYSGASARRAFPELLTAGLKRLARMEGVSLESVLLSGWLALLGRHTRQEDLTAGIPADLRGDTWRDLFGPIENTVVVRVRLDDDPPFLHLVRRAAEQIEHCRRHAAAPFAQVVDAIQPQRDMSHSPFFQVFFECRPALPELVCDHVRFIPVDIDPGTAKYALTLSVTCGPADVKAVITYNTDVFNAATAERMIAHYHALLEGALANPDQRLSELPVLTDAERRQLLVDWNATQAQYPHDQTIAALFEQQVEQRPDAIALRFRDEELTYRELNARANRLAHCLQALGAGPDVPVGLCLPRSIDLVVGTLAILKAGAAYLPLDPDYPAARLLYMIEDAHPLAILVHSEVRSSLPAGEVPIVEVDTAQAGLARFAADNPRSAATASSLAYVMYTSGSTGKPKGVCVEQRGVIRLVRNTNYVELGPQEVVLQFSPMTFDASTFELWASLLNGGKLVVFPPGLPSLEELGRGLREYGITTTLLTTGLLHQMAEFQLPALLGVRQLLTGGDVLSASCARRLLDARSDGVLINCYGPTETTVMGSAYRMTASSQVGATVPIGPPIANTTVYVLDAHGNPAPIGVPGELYIGGPGLARGYLNSPDLTAQRFVPDPFSDAPGARLYKTGDLGRWRDDGCLEFLGRQDYQVKVRGFRIELGEIETHLAAHAGVQSTVVLAREDRPGDKRLVAYVVPRPNTDVTPAALRSYLSSRLPHFAIPSAFVFLPALPLMPHGKIDRSALPAPSHERPGPADDQHAPRTPAEELLARIWAEVLGLNQVGIHDNFFDLGGHSLLAMRVLSRIHDAFGFPLPLRTFFESRNLAELAVRVEQLRDAGQETAPRALLRAPRDGDLPLSFSQEGLWFLERFQPGLAAYNIPISLRLGGPLDIKALTRSLGEIVRRHESLRTTFPEKDGLPLQEIADPAPFYLEEIDLTEVSEPDREAASRRIQVELAQRPFQLQQGPLFRATVLKLSPEEHVLSVQVHHIIFDGWSVSVFLRELGALYEAFAEGRPSPLPDLQIQFADFASWQRTWLQTDAAIRGSAYWRKQLAGPLPVLELPADHPRPPMQTYCGAVAARTLPPALSEQVRRFSRQAGVTDFVTLLAAWKTLLHRYTGQADIVVGTAMAGRSHADTEDLLGFFVNTVVLRSDLSGDPPFAELLVREQSMALAAHEHQHFPFDHIVAELHPDRDVSRSPVFQVMFVVQNTPTHVARFGGLTLREEDIENGTAKFELLLNVNERDGRLTLSMEYNTDLFEAGTAQRILEHYETLLLGALANPSLRLSDLPLLTPEEQQTIEAWNATEVRYPETARLHELFRDQAERTPAAVAVEFEGVTLTYRDLDRRANQLAHHLRALGVGPRSLVGVCLERSIDLIVTLCGVLKAGAAYVPLDPSHPKERLGHVLADASAPVLVTERAFLDRLPEYAGQVLCIGECRAILDREPDTDPGVPVTADDASYVIFTSGSTGRPKGVLNTHGGICNHLLWMRERYPLTTEDRVLQKTPFSFDVSVWEIFWPLTCGARLVVARPEGHRDTVYLLKTIQDRGITNIHFVPSMLRVFLEEARGVECPSVRRVICSGEALAYDLQQRFFECMNADLLNLFGPTEAAVHVTAWECEREGQRGVVPIGRPIANTRMYVLDAHRHWAPIGVVGELYIGGVQLALGYLNRLELTAEAFVPDPFRNQPGARMYKTGDLGRFLPDGAIEFLGRADFQVKIRGNRIELGEIETALLQHPAVRAAVVVVREDTPDDLRLTAYVVPADRGRFDAGALRPFLRTHLPEYMIPNDFVALDVLPLSPNGKVDRRALPAPDRARPALEAAYAAPETPVELAIAEVWSKLLHRDSIGLHDNFFDLGGHSMLAMRAVARLRTTLTRDLQLRDLFEYPVLNALAQRIETLKSGPTAPPPAAPAPLQYDPCVVALHEGGTKRPLFCVLGAGGVNYTYSALASHLDPDQPVFGLQYSHLPGAADKLLTVEEIAARYIQALGSVQPQGPYLLAGWSFGGLVAFEMAQQLHQRGDRAAVLALMDCEAIVPIANPILRALEALRMLSLRTRMRLVMVYHTAPVIRGYLRDMLHMARSRRSEEGRGHPSLREYWNFMWDDIYRQYSMKQAGVTTPSAREERLVMVEDSFILNVLRRMKANEIALKRYAMKPYPGRVTLFRARLDPYGLAERDPTLRWCEIAQDGVDVHVIDGNHLALVREPFAGDLARKLQACLDAAQHELPAL